MFQDCCFFEWFLGLVHGVWSCMICSKYYHHIVLCSEYGHVILALVHALLRMMTTFSTSARLWHWSLLIPYWVLIRVLSCWLLRTNKNKHKCVGSRYHRQRYPLPVPSYLVNDEPQSIGPQRTSCYTWIRDWPHSMQNLYSVYRGMNQIATLNMCIIINFLKSSTKRWSPLGLRTHEVHNSLHFSAKNFYFLYHVKRISRNKPYYLHVK